MVTASTAPVELKRQCPGSGIHTAIRAQGLARDDLKTSLGFSSSQLLEFVIQIGFVRLDV